MITNFEEITYELTLREKTSILPIVKTMLENAIGKSQAITNKDIIDRVSLEGYNLRPSRVRKIIHELRINHTIKRLIATSKGYYISNDKAELMSYLTSLHERINSITEIRNALIIDFDEY